MTTGTISFEVETRELFGRHVRALRREGVTPIHLYGKGISPMSLQAESMALQRLLSQAGRNTPVSVSVKGQPGVHFAFIREVQRHPVSEAILHIDFLEVHMTEIMHARVPVRLTGDAPAVRSGGVLFQALQAITVECLPLDVPPFAEVDVTGLTDFEQGIFVSDVALGDKVTVLTDPGELVARVHAPRVAAEGDITGAPGAEAEGEPTAAVEDTEAPSA